MIITYMEIQHWKRVRKKERVRISVGEGGRRGWWRYKFWMGECGLDNTAILNVEEQAILI